MNKYILTGLLAAGLLLGSMIILVRQNQVKAACADGYVCAGRTVLDFPDGCNYELYYCTQKWDRETVYCGGSCGYSRLVGGWCNTPTDCGITLGHISTNCCVRGGPTPTPNPTPNPTPTPPPAPSCSVSLDPSTISITQGTDANYITSVTNIQNGSVDQVNFSSSNTSVATVDPASDASQPYQTVGNTLAVGSTIITANVVMSGSTRCSDTAVLDVTAPGPWWQVVDSDIIAGGDIISSIPLSCVLPGCNPLFGLEGLGGYPGVPVYGGSTASFGEGDVSSKGWLANTQSSFSKIYNYNYFSKLVRSDVVLTEIEQFSVNGGFFTSGGAPSRGYVWYHFDGNNPITPGDLVINSSVNMPGNRKVVVLIENADLYIDDTINVVNGEGYMMFIVGKDENGDKGNIYIDAGVSHPVAVELEGVFLAEGQFKTGAGSNQLYIRGMVAAYGGIVLERDLEDNNTDEPAEVFEFAPDFILNYPRDLTFKKLRWKEVAP